MKKYSDVLAEWLVELGYTHCFFVAGGNIMHLLESCSRQLRCVPVVHEVAAGIAAEYFNEVGLGAKAFALVTAGRRVRRIARAAGIRGTGESAGPRARAGTAARHPGDRWRRHRQACERAIGAG